jgi:ammonium transporter, Amt family
VGVTTGLSDVGLRTLVESNLDGMLVLDPDGTIRFANPAAARLLGWDAEALRGTAFGLPLGRTDGIEIDVVDAPDRVVALRTSEIRWDGEPAVLAVLRDVTARHRAEQALREANRTLAAVISAAPVAIVRVDAGGRVLAWNPGAERIFGWTEAELLGRRSPIPVSPAPTPGADDVQVTCRDGSIATVSLSLAPVEGDTDELRSVVIVAADVTERRLREEQVSHLASHDQLTGLLNRRSFEELLGRAVSRIRQASAPAAAGALLLVDLDRFKAVNDTAGHLAGDQMLIGVGRAISEVVRPGEAVARFGGDEFAVLVTRADASGARAAAERIRRQIAAFALTVRGERHATTATVGGAVIDGRLDAAEVLAVADVALHAAKDTTRDSVLIQEEAAGKALELAQIGRRAQTVRRALDAGLFAVEHQPLIALATGEPAAYEALIRLPDGGVINLPDQFLPLADSMGLMWEIDRWMTELALATLADPDHPPVWVNLWRTSLGHPAILEAVRAAPAAHVAGRLGFEMPEEARPEHLMRVIGWVSQLRELGCRFALDDFGAQATTFSVLREFPVDLVKVDRQYVTRLADDPIDRQMVRAIVDVCHSLGITVAVEGIEGEASRAAAAELGVDLGQGFLWPPRKDGA